MAHFEEVQTEIEEVIRWEAVPRGADWREEAAEILEQQFDEEWRSFEDAYYDVISKARRIMSRQTQSGIQHPSASPLI